MLALCGGWRVAAVYAAVMTLIIAAHLGPYGLAVWAVAWCVLTYRASSSRRTRGGKPVKETEPSAL